MWLLSHMENCYSLRVEDALCYYYIETTAPKRFSFVFCHNNNEVNELNLEAQF